MRDAATPNFARRECPPEFVEVYLQIGWDGIEDHFHAHKQTIKRWIAECGGDELKARRKEAIRAKRDAEHSRRRGRAMQDPAPAQVVQDATAPVIAAAAQFLRTPRGGGWVVFPGDDGAWRVGLMRKTAAQMVQMADRRGFEFDCALLREWARAVA